MNYMQYNGSSLYGNFRTRTFADIFEDVDIFKSTIGTDVQIPLKITEESLITLYYLLYARYGNSSIASSDENQFIYKIAAIIFQYGPTWEKRVKIQDNLRSLDETELLIGGKAIYNSALNPQQTPTTASLEELPYINQQNTTLYKKSKLEAYNSLELLLKTDVTGEFLDKFKKLFITIVEPDTALWYKTEVSDD